MRFRIEQRFDVGLADVESILVDPDFLARLAELPKLGHPELLDQRTDGHLVHQRIRYAFIGELGAMVRAAVDPAKLTWVEESTIDRRTHTTSWTIVPDHYESLLTAAGTFTLTTGQDGGTRRLAEGAVEVHVPVLGRKVEAAIVSGLEEHAAAEADVLAAWHAERAG